MIRRWISDRRLWLAYHWVYWKFALQHPYAVLWGEYIRARARWAMRSARRAAREMKRAAVRNPWKKRPNPWAMQQRADIHQALTDAGWAQDEDGQWRPIHSENGKVMARGELKPLY